MTYNIEETEGIAEVPRSNHKIFVLSFTDQENPADHITVQKHGMLNDNTWLNITDEKPQLFKFSAGFSRDLSIHKDMSEVVVVQ